MISKSNFHKKCDMFMCQNLADFVICVGIKGNVFACEDCLKKLKKEIGLNINGKTKQDISL